MMERLPENRITIDEIYEHPWIVDSVPDKNLQNTKVRLKTLVKRIKNALKVIKYMKKAWYIHSIH